MVAGPTIIATAQTSGTINAIGVESAKYVQVQAIATGPNTFEAGPNGFGYDA